MLELQRVLPFHLVLWSVQNKCWGALQSTWPSMAERTLRDKEAREWAALFHHLGDLLNIFVEEKPVEPVLKAG